MLHRFDSEKIGEETNLVMHDAPVTVAKSNF
jgi:hypothetical protein